MPIVAVPLIPREGDAPALSGLVVGDLSDGVGELPDSLHLAAEQQEKRLLGSSDLPSAVWFTTDDIDDLEIRSGLICRLVPLQLLGSGVARVSEAWIFNDVDPGESEVEIRTLGLRLAGQGEYALNAGADDAAIEDQLALVHRAVSNNASLKVTLEHWLLALDHAGLSGGLLDMAICLESLIESRTEIRFRFAHQIGRLGTDSPSDLSDFHGLLSDLYDARSAHVHGNRKEEERARKAIKDRRIDLEQFMTDCVRYALRFNGRSGASGRKWKKHLDGLLMGTNSKLVDGRGAI